MKRTLWGHLWFALSLQLGGSEGTHLFGVPFAKFISFSESVND
jgi:hypothetical protein